MKEWVDVNERHPPSGKVVLVTDGQNVGPACMPVGKFGWKMESGIIVKGITHWQPLPDPPFPSGPFYVAKHLNNAWTLYKRGSDDCAHIGMIDECAEHLVDWLNRLWGEK